MQGCAEIIHLEKRLLFFACDCGKDGCINKRKAVIVKKSADGVDDGVADITYTPLALRAKMQVAVL